MNWYMKCLKQYADFSGRARRKEYWMFFLFNFIFAIAATILDTIIGTPFVLYLLYALATIVPSVAVGIRRLHDIGKSGVMILVALIPLIGVIWLIVLLVTEGNQGDNQYGPDPKAG